MIPVFQDGQSESGAAALDVRVLFLDLFEFTSCEVKVTGENDRFCCLLCYIMSFV